MVDDESDRREWMCDGLRDHGVVSEKAASVGEAIGLLHRASFDLVVCDMVLPDPPEASNAALRGYLVVCYALAGSNGVVVQASSLRRLAHAGAVLTNWKVDEVADVVYGSRGIPARDSKDGGCPWSAMQRVEAAVPDQRLAAAVELADLPIVRELATSLALTGPLEALKDAALGAVDWDAAVTGVRSILFPGVG